MRKREFAFDATTLCECLREAFIHFGGTPEQVMFDNAPSIIIERDAYGEGEHGWNVQLLELAQTYGFTPKVCRPYRARTKGKVERFNRFGRRVSWCRGRLLGSSRDGHRTSMPRTRRSDGGSRASPMCVLMRAHTSARRRGWCMNNRRSHRCRRRPRCPCQRHRDHRVLLRESLQHLLAVYDA